MFSQEEPAVEFSKHKISALASAQIVLECAVKELSFMMMQAAPVSILISIVWSLAEFSSFGVLYWFIVVLAGIKMLFLDMTMETLPYIEMMTNMIAFYVLTAIHRDLQEDYFILDGLETDKFGKLYLFSMKFLCALDKHFLVRAGFLFLHAMKKMLFCTKIE